MGVKDTRFSLTQRQPLRLASVSGGKNLAGWVARTRPLAEPLSPRGPQPVLRTLRVGCVRLNGPAEPLGRVRRSWYWGSTRSFGQVPYMYLITPVLLPIS